MNTQQLGRQQHSSPPRSTIARVSTVRPLRYEAHGESHTDCCTAAAIPHSLPTRSPPSVAAAVSHASLDLLIDRQTPACWPIDTRHPNRCSNRLVQRNLLSIYTAHTPSSISHNTHRRSTLHCQHSPLCMHSPCTLLPITSTMNLSTPLNSSHPQPTRPTLSLTHSTTHSSLAHPNDSIPSLSLPPSLLPPPTLLTCRCWTLMRLFSHRRVV